MTRFRARTWAVLALLALCLAGCRRPPHGAPRLPAQDGSVTLGVISDPHGHHENVAAFAARFVREGADAIVMPGDLAPGEHFESALSDYDATVKVIEAAAATGLPTYLLPGNHDHQDDYRRAIQIVSRQHPRIVDLSVERVVVGEGISLVSNPYGTDFTYAESRFRGGPDEIRSVASWASALRGTIVLVTHQPPRCTGEHGIDFTATHGNVGDEMLDEVMRSARIRFSISGHIHEAGGRAVDSEGRAVEPDTWSDDLRLNPGAAAPWEYLDGRRREGMAAILTLENGKAKYSVFVCERGAPGRPEVRVRPLAQPAAPPSSPAATRG